MAALGVILDVDGTLVLSNDAHARAWIDAYLAYGYSVAFDDIRPLIGKGGDRLIPQVTPGLVSESGMGKQISDLRKQVFLATYAPDLQPAPGARELVEELRKRGVKAIIASSAKRDELQALLRAAHVDDLLTAATTQDDVSSSKPAPDTVGVALEKLALPAEDCVLIGDTPYDIESARQAGVAAVALRCGGWDDAHLAGAIAIFDDPADLLAHLDDVPLGGKHALEPGKNPPDVVQMP